MTRLAVAISCHNKVRELTTCVNVLRKHWSCEQPFISVCCNDASSIDAVRALDVDAVTEGIDYRPDGGSKAWRRLRQYDTIKKAVLGCVGKAGCIIQWHADACALDGDVVHRMLDEMQAGKKLVGFRGKWKADDNLKRPLGHVDDHFMLFDALHAAVIFSEGQEQVDWVKSVAGHWSSEGIMSMLIQKHTADAALWHYDDMRNNEIDMDAGYPPDPFYPDGVSHSAIPPFNYDPIRKFLHSDSAEHTERVFRQEGIPVGLICR